MTCCEPHATTGPDVTHIETFDPVPQSAAQARQFVRVRLEGHDVGPDVAEQVVSELVANVVEHARTPIRVALDVGETVRLEVRDGSASMPAVINAAADAERGRGLAIVDELALRWGVTTTPDGKVIWVELERR